MNKSTNWWMVVAIVSLVLLFFGNNFMGFGGCGYSRMGYSGGMMSWMWGNPFSWIFSFVVSAVLIGLAVLILIYFIKMISESLNQQKSSGGKNGKRKNY